MKNTYIGNKEICPACKKANWKIKIHLNLNNYLVCNNCSINLQEIPLNISKELFYQEQQNLYFSDTKMYESSLIQAIESEENRYKCKFVKKYLKKNDSLLEIGAGSGAFAKLIENNNFNISILEESKSLSDFQRKKFKGTVFNSNFLNFKKNTKYSGIFLFQVIEHVIDVNQLIIFLNVNLKHNGLLFLSTPNSKSIQHLLPFNLSINFDFAHNYVFSIKSLKYLLLESGFEILEVKTPEFSQNWLRVITKILRRFKKQDEVSSAGIYSNTNRRSILIIYKIFKIFSFPLRWLQSFFGLGNDIFIIARKKN